MAGLFDTDDSARAAEHLSALTLGQVNNKSMMGTIRLSDSEADHVIISGLAVFMRPTPCRPLRPRSWWRRPLSCP